ncbi:5'-3' exoribonuclease 2 homolog [Choristoneura fumiferana]|uniref:5'-3' exoribonuclease 2 homolog n=1 Tax=Choristoneura fumiferana TaxID=7141 RepID=UPI003D154F78
MPNLPFPYDFERALDDWVFMCFFVGNDFLPHLPSLEIREGAVDRLVNLYKKCVFKTRGWITDSGDVNLERVQLIMDELGRVEDEIFRRRHANELNFRAREKAKKKPQQRPNFQMLNNTQFAPWLVPTAVVGYGTSAKSVENAREEAANMRRAGMRAEAEQEQTSGRGRKRTAAEAGLDEDEDAHDEVRLWEEGFKERYYESKFEVARDNLAFRYRVALQYVRGLCWVLRYYYQGCASWKWYFPTTTRPSPPTSSTWRLSRTSRRGPYRSVD